MRQGRNPLIFIVKKQGDKMLITGKSKEADEFSMKVFGKPFDKLKYAMFTNYVHTNLIEESN